MIDMPTVIRRLEIMPFTWNKTTTTTGYEPDNVREAVAALAEAFSAALNSHPNSAEILGNFRELAGDHLGKLETTEADGIYMAASLALGNPIRAIPKSGGAN